MNSASKVGEIFCEAGASFTRLANLTIHLQSASPYPTNSGKWQDHEIEMLREAVKKYGADPMKISETLKTRSVSQIRNALKTKAFEGLRPPSVLRRQAVTPRNPVQHPQQQQRHHQEPMRSKPDVTLNMLNAAQREQDVSGMDLDVFDGPIEEVA